MPRQAPDQVIEHRISLQDAERAAIIPILNDVKTMTQAGEDLVKVAYVKALAVPVIATVGTLGAVYYAPKVWAYTTEKINGVLDLGEELLDPLEMITRDLKRSKTAAEKAWAWLTGSGPLGGGSGGSGGGGAF